METAAGLDVAAGKGPGRMRIERGGRWQRACVVLLGTLPLALAAGAPHAQSGVERYDYDALGRLIRHIDAHDRVTEYVYDAAGNLLRVIGGALQPAPQVNSIAPDTARRGETVTVEALGQHLAEVVVSATDPAIGVAVAARTPTRLLLELSIGAAAVLGAQSLRFASSAGATQASLTVLPRRPALSIEPLPLAVGPGREGPFSVRLSHADVVDHRLELSVSNGHASVSPPSVTIAAGQTAATVLLRGLSTGSATLSVRSATLAATSAPIFVTGDFTGAGTSYAPLVGVVLEAAASPGERPLGPIVARPLGVAVGRHVREIVPHAWPAGAGPLAVTVAGAGLDAAHSVRVLPPEGVTAGVPVPAPDGRALTVPVTVAADAAPGPRRLVVADAAGRPIPPAGLAAERIEIVLPAPEITSVEPLAVLPGSSVALIVRGRNLTGATAAGILPPDGITVGGTPLAAADGLSATVALTVAIHAPLGPRLLTLTTPAGTSSAVAEPANRFLVVDELRETVSPVLGAPLGVVFEALDRPQRPIGPIASGVLGVSIGPVVRSLAPASGVAGTAFDLTLQGNDLHGVTAVRFGPDAGLTAGAPVVAPDGRSVSVPVTISAAAARELRAVTVLAGGAEIPFASPGARGFLVTGPAPAVASITPNVLVTNALPVELVMRGVNLAGATQVRITPAGGISFATAPAVDATGTELRVAVSAAPGTAPGARVVTVVTPAGESQSAGSPANTLTLTAQAGPTLTPVVAAPLGVLLQSDTAPAPPPIGPLLARPLGVLLEGTPAQPATHPVGPLVAPALGVALGGVATRIEPSGFLPGSTGMLLIEGHGLDAVTELLAVPAAGITLGARTVRPDGRALTVPIAIDASAANSERRIELRQGALALAFAPPSAALARIAAGPPALASIEPILGRQGQTYTLIVRGTNLQGALAVRALPGTGLTFASMPSVNAAGTELTIGVSIAATAPLGAQVIQVLVPGGESSASAVPANTFTVLPP